MLEILTCFTNVSREARDTCTFEDICTIYTAFPPLLLLLLPLPSPPLTLLPLQRNECLRFLLVSQMFPMKPGTHVHLKVFAPSTQPSLSFSSFSSPSPHPPPLQRNECLRFLLVSQMFPVKPGTHVHVKVFAPSTQNPPFKHGLGVQSLASVTSVFNKDFLLMAINLK